MAVSNASLGALGIARDNHGSSTTTTNLAPSGNTDLTTQYEITSVSLSGDTGPLQGDNTYYTLTLSGGSRRSELQSSARLNVSYTASSGNSVTIQQNAQCRIRWNTLGVGWVKASWNDTYNVLREYTLNVTVQA